VNWAQTLGEQLLRVSQLEEQLEARGQALPEPVIRGPAADDQAVRDLRIELQHLRATLEEARIAEAAAKRQLRDAEQRETDLQEALDALKRRPPEIVEKTVEKTVEVVKPCSVCESIKRMVLGIEPVPAKVRAIEVQPLAPEPLPPRTAADFPRDDIPTLDAPIGRRTRVYKGYTAAIIRVLQGAERMLTSVEIAERAGIPAKKAQTNIWHLVREGVVRREGTPGRNGVKSMYRHALAQKEESQC